MGFFDKFSIKSKGKTGIKGGNDPSHPAIQEMTAWIEHPMEFGKKPDSIRIVDHRDLSWPNDKKESCFLLEFTVDDHRFIGFTGPATWCFFNIDFDQLTYDQLYLMYTGWYLTFYTVNSDTYHKEMEGSNLDRVIANLESIGLTNMEVLQNVCFGEDNYYELTAEENGKRIKVIASEQAAKKYALDAILPFYEFVGQMWNPFS